MPAPEPRERQREGTTLAKRRRDSWPWIPDDRDEQEAEADLHDAAAADIRGREPRTEQCGHHHRQRYSAGSSGPGVQRGSPRRGRVGGKSGIHEERWPARNQVLPTRTIDRPVRIWGTRSRSGAEAAGVPPFRSTLLLPSRREDPPEHDDGPPRIRNGTTREPERRDLRCRRWSVRRSGLKSPPDR